MDSKGWQVGRSLLDCHKYMLENHVACDVTFLFPTSDGSKTAVPAHSYMLRCRSPVFEAMLSGNFKENNEDITIIDIEQDVFKEVLRYMYYEQASLSGHNVLHVLFAAKKYFLDGLERLCNNFLKSEMCSDNVCTILNHCLHYDEKQLTEDCMEFLTSHADLILKSEDFLELSQQALCMVLSNDKFGVPKEMELLKACIKWAEKQEKKGSTRAILGEAFYHIRFHALSPEEILEISEDESELLTDKEIIWFLHKNIRQKDSLKLTTDMRKFNVNERSILLYFTITSRFSKIKGTKGDEVWKCNRHNPDRINFQCSKGKSFKGITLYGGYEKEDTHIVDLKLLKGPEVLCRSRSTITSNGTSTPIEVLVTDPVSLEADVCYTIEVDRSGPNTFYGTSGVCTVEMADFTVKFSKFFGPNNNTNEEHGQIPQITFC